MTSRVVVLLAGAMFKLCQHVAKGIDELPQGFEALPLEQATL